MTEEVVAGEWREVESGLHDQTWLRVVATVDGQAIATAGCTVVAGVARFWGAVTLPEWRGRGAYRAMVAARLKVAKEWGCVLALVKARRDTSSPILTQIGFVPYGESRRYAFVPADSQRRTASR